MRLTIAISIISILLLSACAGDPGRKEKREIYFFDLRGFFEKEAERLNAANKTVPKMVSRNNVTEKKRVQLNWSRELELFTESDINKPAWKSSYRIRTGKDITEYIATDSNLKTRSVLIEKDGKGKIRHIQIINKTSNFLYTSTENLNYYPDSVYSIEKTQSVRLMGSNHYIISAPLK